MGNFMRVYSFELPTLRNHAFTAPFDKGRSEGIPSIFVSFHPDKVFTACCLTEFSDIFFTFIVRLKRDGTRAETRFRLSPKRRSPFKSAGGSVQSTSGSRGVGISVSNAGYTAFRGSVRVLAIPSIRQFPLHFSSRASLCAVRFQTHSTFAVVLQSQ